MRGRVRRIVALSTALLGWGCGATSDVPGSTEADTGAAAVEPSGPPGGYEVRLDSERSDPGEFRIDPEAGAVRVQTGPAGIAWHPEDVIESGPLHVQATFVHHGSPVGYREAYGVFVGGLDLDSPDLEYSYLLVRSTGDFLIKRRRGETTETLVDWTPHEAISRVVEEGDEPENTLAVDVLGGETVYSVNGVEVFRMPTPEARPYGVVGLRVNHRLDIRVTDWVVMDRG